MRYFDSVLNADPFSVDFSEQIQLSSLVYATKLPKTDPLYRQEAGSFPLWGIFQLFVFKSVCSQPG